MATSALALSAPGTRPRVILASQSPRRRDLLALIGIPHDVHPADVDESVHPDEAPVPHCERLARDKVHALAVRHPEAVVIGSDTIVVIDGDILGKPGDRSEAIAMLTRLSGRTHTVFTAVAVAHGGVTLSGVESVSVTFRPLDAAQIAAYVDTGEPMDKAGAYGIQGFGATNVERIDGDYFAVMGLPLGRMVGLLRDLGFHYAFGPLTVADSVPASA
ncbi:Maf family protein [Gemmatimonas sp.]|uniref:Maf family protein n=1 Tax=Gemmatimonas sp. TaxID=1962908 RepID=UPI0039831018